MNTEMTIATNKTPTPTPIKINKKIVKSEVDHEDTSYINQTAFNELIHRGTSKVRREQKPWGKKRQRILTGRTYRTQHPDKRYRIYITINDEVDDAGQLRPFEIFLQSSRTEMQQWMAFAGMSITRILRHKDNLDEIIEDMKSISDAGNSGYMLKGVNYRSVVAEIGYILEEHCRNERKPHVWIDDDIEGLTPAPSTSTGFICPECGSTNFIHQENCDSCAVCGYNKCGE